MVIGREIPRYNELPILEKTGDAHAWDVWGRDDDLGTINHLTPARVAAAAQSIRSGRVSNLNLPLNVPTPALSAGRKPYKHHMEISRSGRDDRLDNFYLQYSSQWDSLRHIRNREYGYWTGLQDDDVDAGRLGIDNWARHGIVCRGVLVDVPLYFHRRGSSYSPQARVAIDGHMLEEMAADEGIRFQPGDILLLRTGWLGWYLAQSTDARERLTGSLHPNEGGLTCPGLDAHRETAAWLWDNQIAAIAADNPALEALKVDAQVGFQHRRLIALQGMPVGEFWRLDELADACSKDRHYDFMLSASPLNLPGGVGSPANVYAIK